MRIIETLSDNYGQERKREENGANVSVKYMWNGKNTILQVDMIESRVIITVGLAELQ